MTLPTEELSVAGGAGATQAGANGSTAVHSTPYLEIRGPSDPLLHDTETIQWHGLGFAPFQATADLKAHGNTAYQIAQPAFTSESFAWDTRTVPDGVYDLRVAARDADGRLIVEETQTVLVNNAAIWHAGTISADETWAADRVHIVESNATIGQGARVTVSPGAIVKFARGTSLTVADGGFLDALGAAESPIVFTSLQDDSAGGDTNLDAAASVPLPGDWVGIPVQGSGQFTTNEFVDLRYLATTHAGALPGNQVWAGTVLHHVTDNVIVPDGMALTINPGAVVKFDANKGITVQSGGTLIAQGSLVQPITFTSIKDDSVAGDSNGDGSVTAPAPGDWTWLFMDGGQATIDHALLRYGAGPTTVGDGSDIGVVRTKGSAVVTLANSVIHDSFWGGVTAWEGGDVTVTNTLILGAERAVTSDGGAVRLAHCTLDANHFGLWPHGGRLEVTNSTITNSTNKNVNGGPDVRYSNIWSPSGDSYELGVNGNISVDPLFKDAERGNYRLGYRSPLIDAADGTAGPATDFAGASRYDDPRTANTGVATPGGAFADMGAFEFVETADSNVDLLVTSVTGPSAAVAGEQATIEWTITNVGTGPAFGPW
ncbi:MAG: right-handed parallel beta-helix repeat-containing protein, partial [Planctomycetes bacterium]|nr:right-handed parallel beta-helix repeat-containing protein [Planctomycetota bacterium]